VDELTAPSDVAGSPDATEVLRAWIINHALHCSLRTGAFPDAGTWGVFLADIVRHVAEALEQDEGLDPHETIRRIRSEFNNELDAPSS